MYTFVKLKGVRVSKKILFTLLVISNLSIAEELTFAEKAQASFLIGIKNGITGIANNVIDTNISKISNNMEQVESSRQKSQLKYYKEQYKKRGQAISKLNKERNQLIGKFNKKYNQLIKKFNILKNEHKNFKRTIKEYKTELGDDYFHNKKKQDKRDRAKADLKKQLKGA